MASSSCPDSEKFQAVWAQLPAGTLKNKLTPYNYRKRNNSGKAHVIIPGTRREPQPGDLIEIFRLGYEHWAIYVGDGYVIHLAPPSEYPGAGSSSIFSVLSSRAVVKRERLEDVVGGCRYKVNNLLDHKYTPRPAQVIINAAKEKVGEEMPYSILHRNCEHFVTDLRYGVPECRQVQNAVIGGGTFLGLGLLAAFGFSVLNRRRQNQ